MKHFYLLSVLVFLLPAGAMAQFAWYGKDGKAQVNTGLLGDESIFKWQGEWWYYVDSEVGSESELRWDNDGYIIDDNLVESCKGVSGTAVFKLKKNQKSENLIGFGFYVVGVKNENNKGVAGDASIWNGLSVYYTSDRDMILQLDGTDETLVLMNANAQYILPAAPEGKFVRIPWSKFKQPDTYVGRKKINGPEAASQLVSVLFTIRSGVTDGSYHFRVDAVGSYDMEAPTAIEEVESCETSSQSYYDLSGRLVQHPSKGIYIKNGKKVLLK
jgi:hypothetical protein